MTKGNPEVDIKFSELVKTLRAETSTKTLRNLDQKVLRRSIRDIEKVVADLRFYLDVRNEQGRGGKK